MMQDDLEILKGQVVEVMANGLFYKGILIGASEESVSLQTPLQWVELPMEQISLLRRSES